MQRLMEMASGSIATFANALDISKGIAIRRKTSKIMGFARATIASLLITLLETVKRGAKTCETSRTVKQDLILQGQFMEIKARTRKGAITRETRVS